MSSLDHSHPYFPTMKAREPFWDAEDPTEVSQEDLARAHPKTAADHQRIKLDKLLKHIDKPVLIPDAKKDWEPPEPPEFVRNVVGSSAGAGSGEYHIYRNLRRKEYARLDFRDKEAKKEAADTEWDARFDQHKKEAEERTAKKRAKRLKKKKATAKKRKTDKGKKEEDDDDDEDDDEDETSGDAKEEATVAEPAQKSS